jgi:hypothetical protein
MPVPARRRRHRHDIAGVTVNTLNQGMHWLLAAALVLPSAGAGAQATGPEPEATRIQSIAEEAYIYGLPIVMNYAVMYSFSVDHSSPQFKAPFNQLHNEARVLTPKDTVVVTPNSDTPYSMAWLDLRAEPVVISVPAVDRTRYYSVMLCDGNTFNYGLFGSLSTGTGAGDYLAAGPGWTGKVPKGIKQVFRSTTQFSLALFRTQLSGQPDLDRVKAVQAGYRVRTLSAYTGSAAPPAPASIDFPKIDKELARTNFFAYLDFALQFAPAGPEEKGIRDKLASIGIGVGKFEEFKSIAARYPRELAMGVKSGVEKVDQAVATTGERRNGWLFSSVAGGNREFFAGDWLRRAALAKAGIYGLNASEALYPMTRTLADGEALDGSRHRYTLTFPAGELPPASAFWSLTLYDGVSQLLVENAINRYLINSPMLPTLKKNADGSLTLYIQKDSPGAEKGANWLPAPDGPIYLVLRIYGPQQRVLKNQWQIPPLVRAD